MTSQRHQSGYCRVFLQTSKCTVLYSTVLDFERPVCENDRRDISLADLICRTFKKIPSSSLFFWPEKSVMLCPKVGQITIFMTFSADRLGLCNFNVTGATTCPYNTRCPSQLREVCMRTPEGRSITYLHTHTEREWERETERERERILRCSINALSIQPECVF